MTAIRLPISFSLAALTTIALFWSLGMLVSEIPTSAPVRTLRGIQFTSKIPETPVEHIIRVPEPIVKPSPPPDASVVTNVTPIVTTGIGESDLVAPDVFTQGIEGTGTPGARRDPSELGGGTDRGAIPQVRIEPDYPALAKARGIEGWITVRCTVTREGRVKDVEVVAADPPHVFDQATLRAVSNWRYQPRLEDGQPVEQRGVTVTLRFELDRS